MKTYLIIILILFSISNARIQSDSTLTDISWFPLIGYSPETKVILGAAGNILFKQKSDDIKPSSVSPLLVYTSRKQYTIGVFSDIYSENKKHHTETAFEYSKFPNSIFAPSSDTEEQYTPKSLTLGIVYSYEIEKNIFAGIRYIYKNYRMDESESGGIIDQLFNSEHNHLSGFGLTTSFDSRNHLFAPSSGIFSSFVWTNYGKIIGSKSAFSSYEINHQHYLSIAAGLTFAYQANMSVKLGDVPFYELNTLGNQSNLRGYHSGKFYGKNKFSFQTEFRKGIFQNYEMVLFAGMGNTANDVKDSLSKLKSAFGLGVRYYLDVTNRVPLRLDFAWGENGASGVYLSLLQAF